MGLSADARRRYIIERIQSAGRVEVSDVVSKFDVSDVTVRRDLESLVRQGLLRKVYGGAVASGSPEIDASVRYRRTRNLKAKKEIGVLAARELVKDGDVIYLEAGSTCYEIIPYLANHKDLTIVVNSLYLMTRLGEMVQHKVILIGGEYRADRMDLRGAAAEAAIRELGGFKAFTSADDISIEGGLSGADVETVTFTKIVLERAAKVYFVGDHTKFDNPALYRISGIDRLDAIVTDRQLSPRWLEAARQNAIEVIYPTETESGEDEQQ